MPNTNVLLPYNKKIIAKLKELGFESIYDIVDVEEERFRLHYDAKLGKSASAIYSQAKNYISLANEVERKAAKNKKIDKISTPSAMLLANDAEHRASIFHMPIYNVIFDEDKNQYVEPGTIESLDSPVKYLLHLLHVLSNLSLNRDEATDRLFQQRPDLESLMLDQATFRDVLPTSEMVTEILTDAVKAIDPSGKDDVLDKLSTAKYPLTLPFDAAYDRINIALTNASLSFGNMVSVLSSDYRLPVSKTKVALALSGIPPGLQKILTDSSVDIENDFGAEVKVLLKNNALPVDVLCQAAGINSTQLAEIFYPGTGSLVASPGWKTAKKPTGGDFAARYLWGPEAAADTGKIDLQQIKVTEGQLHRLQKLIRLQHHTQLSFADLDLILSAATSDAKGKSTAIPSTPSAALADIDATRLAAFGVFARYREAYKVSADQFAALMGSVSAYALIGKTPLVDSLFASLADPKVITATSTIVKDNVLIAAALNIPTSSLITLASLLEVTVLDLPSLSLLYRPILLAQLFDISVDKLLKLIELLGVKIKDAKTLELTLNLLVTLDEAVSWCAAEQWSLDEVITITNTEVNLEMLMVNDLAQFFPKGGPKLSDMLADFNSTKTPSEEALVALAVTRETVLQIASVVATHLHLDVKVAYALIVYHQHILIYGLPSLVSLMISAAVVRHYNLDEVALTPLLGKNHGLISTSEWKQLLSFSDFAKMAIGDERLRPVVLSPLKDVAGKPAEGGKLAIKESLELSQYLVDIYAADTNALSAITGSAFDALKFNLLARRMAFCKISGWSLTSLNQLLDTKALETWAGRFALSLLCGVQSASTQKKITDIAGEHLNVALLAYYKSVSRNKVITDGKKLNSDAFDVHFPDTVDVAGQLLIDPEMSSKVFNSRVSEAIASVQAFIQRIAEGLESEFKLTAGELKKWREIDSRYSLWSSNVQLYWHPDQFVHPLSRQNKTAPFEAFESSLLQARLDDNSVEKAVNDYLRAFETIVNLDTIGAYQDGMDQSLSPIYFLGRSKNAPYEYFFRRWGINSFGMRVWTQWEKIDQPTSSNALSQKNTRYAYWEDYWKTKGLGINKGIIDRLPVQARLTIFNGRLYFIWVEVRPVGQDELDYATSEEREKENDDANKTEPPKKFRHVISVINRRIGGGWGAPVDVYQGPATAQGYLDLNPHLSAFTIPEHGFDLNSLKRTDNKNKVFDAPQPAGDLLLISLLPLPCDPKQTIKDDQKDEKKANEKEIKSLGFLSRYIMLDSFLDEITPKSRWNKGEVVYNSTGIEIDTWEENNGLSSMIHLMNENSLFWIKKTSNDPISGDTQFYSTRVTTPCIPSSWLYNNRHMQSRGQKIYGNTVPLKIGVENAGNIGHENYTVTSTVTLSQAQFDHIPSGKKLMHVMSLQGRTYTTAIEKETLNNELKASIAFIENAPSAGLLRHGLVLVDSKAENVSFESAESALIESGQLCVAKVEPQAVSAEIRENYLGVQFLINNAKKDHLSAASYGQLSSYSGHSIAVDKRTSDVEFEVLNANKQQLEIAKDLKGVELRVVSATDLLEEINSASKLMLTDKKWGWVKPQFYDKGGLGRQTLTRTYRLLSSDAQYLVLKIQTAEMTAAVDPEDETAYVGISAWVKSSMTMPTHVLALKTGGTIQDVDELKIDSEGSGAHFVFEGGRVTLRAKSKKEITDFYAKYQYCFIALGWTANSLRTAAEQGISLQLANLKSEPLFSGVIPCEVPLLANLEILSSCSPAEVRIGDIVTLDIELDMGTKKFTDDSELQIVLHKSYEVASGASGPSGLTLPAIGTSGGIINYKINSKVNNLHFVIPLRVLSACAEPTPLMNIRIHDGISNKTVELAQPRVIARLTNKVDVDWTWCFGPQAGNLFSTPADAPLSVQMLQSPYLLTCLSLTPHADGQQDNYHSLTIILPKGMEIESDAVKLASLNTQLDIRDAMRAGGGWGKGTTKDGITTLKLNGPVNLNQRQFIALPLKLTDTSAAKKFIGSVKVNLTVQGLDKNVWEAASGQFVDPVEITGKLALSIGGLSESNDLSRKVPYGEKTSFVLLMTGLSDTACAPDSIVMDTGHMLSYTGAPVIGTLISKDGKVEEEILPTKSYDPVTGKLTISLNGSKASLLKDQQYSVLVTMDVRSDSRRDPNSDSVTNFTVKLGQETQTTAEVAFPAPILSGMTCSVIPVLPDSVSYLSAPMVAVGSALDYLVSINMSAEAIEKQTLANAADVVKEGYAAGTAKVSSGLSLTIELSDNLVLDPVKSTAKTLNTGALRVFTAVDNAELKLEGESLIVAVGVEGQTLKIETAIDGNNGISGTIRIPVTVKAAGEMTVTLNVNPNQDAENSPRKWGTVEGEPISAVSSVMAYALADMPQEELEFNFGEGDDFSDPINTQAPVILDNGKNKINPQKRLIRLNSKFGKDLVRTASRDTNSIFKGTTQDTPLPAMENDGNPDVVEQDSANLQYFWELFYHIPMLIAYRYNVDGGYDQAQAWLNRLFDPFAVEVNGHKPEVWGSRLLNATFETVALELNGLVDPDMLASAKPEYYKRATFFAYVKNLMDKGDSLYRELSRDGFNQAHQCYLIASRLLGEEPKSSGVKSWEPIGVGTALSLKTDASAKPGTLFALPRSNLYQEMLVKLQSRLFNLRNGLTLDGKPLDLPLFDPTLDPSLLFSVSGKGAQTATRLALSSKPTLPPFRYSVIAARCNSAVETLVQFGGNLLSMADRQQDLHYQSLLITQQQEMASFAISMQKETLRMGKEARKGLEAARDSAASRLQEISLWVNQNVSERESHALYLRSTASSLGIGIGVLNTVGAGVDMAPNVFGFSNGGMVWGSIPRGMATVMAIASDVMNADAQQAETREMYSRRLNEWKVSQFQVEGELKQLEAQLKADTIQEGINERQLAQIQAQTRQFGEQKAFMQIRFTNEALYQWLVSQISSLFNQTYDIVASLCMMAQSAWRYEVADYDVTTNFFQNSGWTDSRRGLLAGETLRLGLLKMEQAFLQRATRSLEIKHTFSVKQSLGNDFGTQLKTKAGDKKPLEVNFKVTEKDLAERYPSLYLRQLVAVSVTLPCVLGPYEDICAMLIQKNSRFALKAEKELYPLMLKGKADKNIIKDVRPLQQVALSSGLEDSGAFILNFGDEKFLPFEGNGVVGEWCIQFPNPTREAQKQLLDTLSDIIVTFHYRAKDGGDQYGSDVLLAIESNKE